MFVVKKESLYEYYSFKGKDNFISYANTVAKMFDSEAVRKQLKNHCSRISRLFKNAEDRFEKDIREYIKQDVKTKLFIAEIIRSFVS